MKNAHRECQCEMRRTDCHCCSVCASRVAGLYDHIELHLVNGNIAIVHSGFPLSQSCGANPCCVLFCDCVIAVVCHTVYCDALQSMWFRTLNVPNARTYVSIEAIIDFMMRDTWVSGFANKFKLIASVHARRSCAQAIYYRYAHYLWILLSRRLSPQ